MKVRYVVQCNRHGAESKDWHGKQVVVQKPKTNKDRKEGGCPHCKAERLAAEKSSSVEVPE